MTPSQAHCNVTVYDDVIMGAMTSQITSLMIVYSTVYSGADQRKHQSSASLAFVRGIHRGPVNSPHKWPVTRKMFPFDDVTTVVTVIRGYKISICCPTDTLFSLLNTSTSSTLIYLPWTKWPPFRRRYFHTHFVNEKFYILSKLHWSLFLRAQLTITQHWFR